MLKFDTLVCDTGMSICEAFVERKKVQTQETSSSFQALSCGLLECW